jgi:hypothetical protein
MAEMRLEIILDSEVTDIQMAGVWRPTNIPSQATREAFVVAMIRKRVIRSGNIQQAVYLAFSSHM